MYRFCASLRHCILIILLGTLGAKAQQDAPDTTAGMPEGSPKVIHQPVLRFPEMAREAGLAVSMQVKVSVGTDGKTYKTNITKRDPEFVYLFDDDVRRWAMGFEFEPMKKKDGTPISFFVTVPVRFVLKNFVAPTAKDQPLPEYPKEALQMGMEGWVGLAVLVDRQGMRKRRPVIVAREPVTTTIFDDAALDVASNTSFIPATMNGSATEGWIFMKIPFTLSPR